MDQSQGLMKKKQQAPDTHLQALNDFAVKLRTLEDRFFDFQRRSTLNEENMIKSDRKTHNDVKDLFSELTDVKHVVNELNNKIELLIKEMDGFAKKRDVQVMGKYINLWDPTRFVSQNEIEELVENLVDEKLKKKKV